MSSLTKKNNITENNIVRKYFAYIIPAVIGMVFSSLYTVIDGIFVGRGVGENALAAINIVLPFIMLQIAFAVMIAIGGGIQYSLNKAKGKLRLANNIFTQSMISLIFVTFLLNIVALLFMPQVCKLLGANAVLQADAEAYMKWIALSGLIFMPSLGLSVFIRNDNAPKLEMVGTLTGALTNILLDYLFIMRFNMGIEGAAMATGIGQLVSASIYSLHFLNKDRYLYFQKPIWSKVEMRKIFFSGVPSFLMQLSQATISYSFNIVIIASIGAIGVSSYSIVVYIGSVFNMMLIGVVQGTQPILSYNFGAKNKENVKSIYKLAICSNIILISIIYVATFIFGKNLASIFVKDNFEVINITENMMNYYFLAFFPIGISLINILYFQVAELAKISIFLSIIRCFGFVQLFLVILPPYLGSTGIYLSLLAGESVNCLVSMLLFKSNAKAMNFEHKSLSIKT